MQLTCWGFWGPGTQFIFFSICKDKHNTWIAGTQLHGPTPSTTQEIGVKHPNWYPTQLLSYKTWTPQAMHLPLLLYSNGCDGELLLWAGPAFHPLLSVYQCCIATQVEALGDTSGNFQRQQCQKERQQQT